MNSNVNSWLLPKDPAKIILLTILSHPTQNEWCSRYVCTGCPRVFTVLSNLPSYILWWREEPLTWRGKISRTGLKWPRFLWVGSTRGMWPKMCLVTRIFKPDSGDSAWYKVVREQSDDCGGLRIRLGLPNMEKKTELNNADIGIKYMGA